MVKLCSHCSEQRAVLRRPKTFEQLCKQCFFAAFEEEVHQTIVSHSLFSPGERVAVGASGGKDSTVLAHLLTLLNKRHNYGLELFLLSVDEGISGYRDHSLETVQRNQATYEIPLHVLSYKELYGWTMDEIVAEVGNKSNCSFCGVFRRQALERGAQLLRASKLATGHNADDIAETVLLNMLIGDVARLCRCSSIITGRGGPLPRVKPLMHCYQKEIVMYAYFQRLDYFSTECVYAAFAPRIRFAREFVKELEAARPRAVLDLIRSGEQFGLLAKGRAAPLFSSAAYQEVQRCGRCGYMSSQELCKACMLLEGLNSGLPRLGLNVTRGSRRGAGQRPASVAALPPVQSEGSAAPGGSQLASCADSTCKAAGKQAEVACGSSCAREGGGDDVCCQGQSGPACYQLAAGAAGGR